MIAAVACGVLLTLFLLSWKTTGVLAAAPSAILDNPNERSLHTRPTPRTGGIAIVTTYLAGVAALAALFAYTQRLGEVGKGGLWILAMLLVIATVSRLDDRYDLPFWLRLVVHLGAASGVVLGGGFAVREINVPFHGPFSLGALAAPLSILVITWMINLYNFMDGMDGLAAAMSLAGFGALTAVALQRGDVTLAALAALALPAVLGFLMHNRPPASIFMGDVGSTSLGFLAGALTVAGTSRHTFELSTALIAFSPFLVDATVTLLRRAAQRKRFWQAHREHYYQRLVLAGWGHRKTLIAECIVMAACAAAAIAFENGSHVARVAIFAVLAIAYLALAAGVRAVERRKQP